MTRLARSEARKPIALAHARHAISLVDRRAPLDANALACCLYIRQWLRYTHEAPETIADLDCLTRYPAGDCDDMVVALAALLLRLGYGYDGMAWCVGWRGAHPAHVWLAVDTPRWGVLQLDPSTWRFDPPTPPAPYGRFSSVTTHPLR
ncbi:MAG: hypothetical protein V3U45_07095 [bacterium]